MTARLVPGSGATAPPTRWYGVAEHDVDRLTPRRQRVVVPAGLPRPEEDHGHDRGARDQREVRRAAVDAGQVSPAAPTLGEDADGAARRAAPAGRSSRPAGRTRNRSSGICPDAPEEPSEPALEHLDLGQACTGRGAKIASSGPSMTPTWLAAKMTGPRGRHSARRRAPGPPIRRRTTNRAIGRNGTSMNRRRWADPVAAGPLECAGRWRTSRGLLDRLDEGDHLVDDLVQRVRRWCRCGRRRRP